jgi:hypothetical protein
MHWRAPIVARKVENNQGPVVAVVEYHVEPNDRAEFLSAVDELGYARRRDSAYAWESMRTPTAGFIETFSINRSRCCISAGGTHADEMLSSRVRQLLKEAARHARRLPERRTGIGESARETSGLERVNQGLGYARVASSAET